MNSSQTLAFRLKVFKFIRTRPENLNLKGKDNQSRFSIPSLALGIFGEDTEAKPKYNLHRLRPSGRSSRRLIKYWLPVIICAILIFYLSSLTSKDIPDLFIGKDIIEHLIEYACFALLLSRALKAYNPKLSYNKRILWVCVIAIIYALSDEFHQSFVAGRNSSGFDLSLDAIGSLMGSLLYRWQK